MVTRTGQVRVADTGLNALTRQSSVLHTGSDHWPYKSPEELENPREVTAAMDTYSFAVTAYVVCDNHVHNLQLTVFRSADFQHKAPLPFAQPVARSCVYLETRTFTPSDSSRYEWTHVGTPKTLFGLYAE